jgi:peptidoglycan/LPS O-acetylase OafA/YrhL
MAGDKKIYFEPLDGFRAFAAIFILFVHSRFECFKVLWIGVPMFFVLSGFLITRILIENKNAVNYFKIFYFKRSLRIFPVYYLTLFVCVLWGLYSHADLSQLAVYAFYLQNFVISTDIPPEFCFGLMRHTWSLSVEEIFYLIWPLVVYVLSLQNLYRLCIIAGVSNILFKLLYVFFFYVQAEEPFLMLSLVGNIDSLMAGAFLGLLSLNKDSFIYARFPGKLFLFIYAFFFITVTANYLPVFNERYAYLAKVLLSSVVSILSFFILARLISSVNRNSFAYKFLTFKSLVFIGKISYGIYLYHNIVYRLVDSFIFHYHISINPLLTLLVQISITFLIAAVSWHLIEKPVLRLKDKYDYHSL